MKTRKNKTTKVRTHDYRKLNGKNKTKIQRYIVGNATRADPQWHRTERKEGKRMTGESGRGRGRGGGSRASVG